MNTHAHASKIYNFHHAKEDLLKEKKWLLGSGVLFILLGALALSTLIITTVTTLYFLGALLFVTGTLLTINTLKLWRRTGLMFSSRLAFSLMYLIIGGLFIFNPLEGAISLTLILAIFYIVQGIYRIAVAVADQIPNWQWEIAAGIITALFGLVILLQWPVSGLWTIGFFVGLDFILIGWSFVMLASNIHKQTLEKTESDQSEHHKKIV